MSLIKDLKNNKENSVNVVEFMELIAPDLKTKYTELMVRIFKSSVEQKYADKISEAITALKTLYPEKESEIDSFSSFNTIFISYMFDIMHDTNINIENIKKFVEYNERNLIEKNDITTYKTYDEIHNQVIFAEMKVQEKELEKQVVKLFEDEDWFMLKPLTYESSMKYGYNTKWCTAMETDKTYFNRYTKEGVLIYFINKKTTQKVAVYKKLFDGTNPIKTTDITFWNEIDKQIDSFSSGLPGYLLDELRNHFEKHPITNKVVLELLEGKKPGESKTIGKEKDAIGVSGTITSSGLNYGSTGTINGNIVSSRSITMSENVHSTPTMETWGNTGVGTDDVLSNDCGNEAGGLSN